MKPAWPTGPGRVLVMGAGSVGCYVGGCLQTAGVTVDLVGRRHTLDALRANGLRTTDLDGHDRRLAATALNLHEQLDSLTTAPDLVLLCVKNGATTEAAVALAAHLPAGTPLVSFQNGMHNAEQVRAVAPALNALPGMVPYNIASLAPGHFHRGTSGRLAALADPALTLWQPVFETAGIPLDLHQDMRPLQWGKLLLNLNNAVNALSGLPLRDQLLDAGHRRQFAALVAEGLGVLKAAGIQPARLTPLPWPLLVRALALPTPLFRLVAARMLRIDPLARSSMADDLATGRPTEIRSLCGEIVCQAQAHGRSAPLNAEMVARVEALAH